MYQSEECKQILEEVLKAKRIADEPDQDIESERQHSKRKSKQLLDMLAKIGRSDHSKNKCMEMKQTEYKSKVEDMLVQKYDALEKDMAECDKESDDHKKYEHLKQLTKQQIQEVQKSTQIPKQMMKMNDGLNEEIKQKQTNSEKLTEVYETLPWGIDAAKLYRAHHEVAHFSELAYLTLREMPDVTIEVLETANNAKTQHHVASGLMKMYKQKVDQIVNTEFPPMRVAFELKDRETILKICDKINDTANNMNKEAEDTQVRYKEIRSQILSNTATLDKEYRREIDRQTGGSLQRYRDKWNENQESHFGIQQKRTNALNRLAKIRELAMVDVNISNTESLRKASEYLREIDQQLTRIIMFWSHIAVVHGYLMERQILKEMYLMWIETEYDDEVKKSILEKIKSLCKDWTNFGRICQDYIEVNESEIDKLYAFPSSHFGQMPAGDRKELLKELIEELEDDIDKCYP